MANLSIGPWVGEFGIWIMHIVPFINGWRLKYPNANIVVSAYEGDEAYLVDIHGVPTYNEYIPMKFWQAPRGRAKIYTEIPPFVRKIEHDMKQRDGYINVVNIESPEYRSFFLKRPLARYMWGGYPRQPILKDTLVIVPRTPSIAHSNNRSWAKEKWLELTQRLLADGWTIYVTGIEQDYLNVINSPKLINYSNLPDGERQRKSLDIMGRALCAIGDSSGGSQIPLYCGCPLVVHTIAEDRSLYDPISQAYRNYFGAHVWFHGCPKIKVDYDEDPGMKDVDVETRYNQICTCLEEAKILTKRYEIEEFILH
jgi:hypothetical protein